MQNEPGNRTSRKGPSVGKGKEPSANQQNDREEEKGGPRPTRSKGGTGGRLGKPGKAERGRGD